MFFELDRVGRDRENVVQSFDVGIDPDLVRLLEKMCSVVVFDDPTYIEPDELPVVEALAGSLRLLLFIARECGEVPQPDEGMEARSEPQSD